MKNVDKWSSFANLLGNLIAKYSDVLDIDPLPDPDISSEDTKTNGIDFTDFEDVAEHKAA